MYIYNILQCARNANSGQSFLSSTSANDDVQALSKSTLHGHNDISDASVAPVECIPAHDRNAVLSMLAQPVRHHNSLCPFPYQTSSTCGLPLEVFSTVRPDVSILQWIRCRKAEKLSKVTTSTGSSRCRVSR